MALQQRLSAVGYWLGTPDGTYGDATEQAVAALQKAAGISRSGVVGPATQEAPGGGRAPTAPEHLGYVIEIDLEDDLVMFVTNGRIDEVLNTSTGGGYTYTQDGVTAVATTPTGHFAIYRQVNGLWSIRSVRCGRLRSSSMPASPSTATRPCRRNRSPTGAPV